MFQTKTTTLQNKNQASKQANKKTNHIYLVGWGANIFMRAGKYK